jgi:hypothetical protein
MIVDDLDMSWSSSGPHEANPPLIVDSNTMLAGSVGPKGFQTISRRNAQVAQIDGPVEQAQFAQGDILNIRRQTPASLAVPDADCLSVSKAQDHTHL